MRESYFYRLLLALASSSLVFGEIQETPLATFPELGVAPEQETPPPMQNDDPERKEERKRDATSRLQIGGNYTHVKIRPHGFDSFKGNLGGAQGMYEFRPKNNFYAGVKLAWKQGTPTGSAGKRSLFYLDAQERLGFTVGDDGIVWRAALFSGVGYRYYGQKFTPNTFPFTPVKFRYNEIYIPAGLLTDFACNDWFGVGLAGTWMPQVYPTVKIVPLGGARWILTHTLKNYSIEMPFTFTLTKDRRSFLILNPSYEHWQDGHSKAKAASGVVLGLPGNSYHFWGVDLNYAYAF